MRIVVLDSYTLNPGDNPWDQVARLGELKVYENSLPQEVVERAADADIILVNKVPLPETTLERLPRLKLIGVLATGYNVVDTAAARRRGIPVCNVPIYGTDAVAQFTFALILELCHQVGRHSAAVKAGAWEKAGQFSFWESPQIELAGKNLGIVGFGRIGRRVAVIARAFGMNIFVSSRTRKEPAGAVAWKTLEELFAESDFVSLHCPQTEENTGMVNRELLRRMKPTAFLVNTSRGALVAEQDLADALREGLLAGAACDVVTKEPIAGDNPLLHAPNILITPHMAWAAREARMRLMRATAENIAAFLAGRPMNVVN